jgi:hypothetical protein
MNSIERIAQSTGAMPSAVLRELASAERRSEPDAREVYGRVRGMRFVARRAHCDAEWAIVLERRPGPWERAPRTGWTG